MLSATLFIAHLIGDFPMQYNWVFRWKVKHWVGIAIHVLIHLLVTALLIEAPWRYPQFFALLGATHFCVDWAKVNQSSDHKMRDFWLDQLAHFVIILGLSWLFPMISPALPLSAIFWLAIATALATAAMLLIIIPQQTDHLTPKLAPLPTFRFAHFLGTGALIAAVLFTIL